MSTVIYIIEGMPLLAGCILAQEGVALILCAMCIGFDGDMPFAYPKLLSLM